mgnify:CR=1 FL=1
MLSDFVFYNCGVLAAQLMRSQAKNSPRDCFLNAATVLKEIKNYLVIKPRKIHSFGVFFLTAVSSQQLKNISLCLEHRTLRKDY